MSLNQETISHIHEFMRFQELYQPSQEVKRGLASRSFIGLVAPAAMGKTYLMNRVTARDERFGRVSVISTRRPRPDDEPGMFRLFEHNDENLEMLRQKVLNGELVQYAYHPSELTFYGTEVADYPKEKNMLATLSGAINQLQNVGFKETTFIGVAAPPSDWRRWFDARYKHTDPVRLSRLKEAEKSYSNLLKREDISWVMNREGEADQAAEDIIRIADGEAVTENDEVLAYAQRILQLVETEKTRGAY